MYIYLPIADPTVVGDVTTPFFGVVPVDHTPVRALSLLAEFKLAHYVPFCTTRCNIICILIYNEAGEKMSLTSGRVVVSLTFSTRC